MIKKFPSTDTVPFGVIKTERVVVQSVTSLIRFVIILKIVFQMKQIQMKSPNLRPTTYVRSAGEDST